MGIFLRHRSVRDGSGARRGETEEYGRTDSNQLFCRPNLERTRQHGRVGWVHFEKNRRIPKRTHRVSSRCPFDKRNDFLHRNGRVFA